MRTEQARKSLCQSTLNSDVKVFVRLQVQRLEHDEQLRITLDLDGGVKVNYGIFGDFLEGVKAVTGGVGDE